MTAEKIPVSHLPVLAPSWCWMPDDVKLYARPAPVCEAPALIILDENSRCPCGQKYDPDKPVVERISRLYTLVKAVPCRIQLQRCPACPSTLERAIGPDPRDLGIFNFDNRNLATHDLLDDYTSSFMTSETPFFAWVKTLFRRYKDYKSPCNFMYHKVFRSVWFAYAKIQTFEGDMVCSICGPYPESIICDGTALRMNEKNVLPTVKPPTISVEGSSVRSSRYIGKQQVIQDANLRKEMKRIIAGPRLPSREELEKLKATATDRKAADKLAISLKLVIAVEDACVALSSISTGLGTLFRNCYSAFAVANGLAPDRALTFLFKQVSACCNAT